MATSRPQPHGMPNGVTKTNMSSYIRDTLYAMPQRGAGQDSSTPRTGQQHYGLANPAVQQGASASARGSHSSKFAVLNSLANSNPTSTQNAIYGAPQEQQQQQQASVGATSSGRGARQLDLTSLLAGVAPPQPHPHANPYQPHQQGQPSAYGSTSDIGNTSTSNPPPPHQPTAPKPRHQTQRIPRTLSGRPRPPLNAAPPVHAGPPTSAGSASTSRKSSASSHRSAPQPPPPVPSQQQQQQQVSTTARSTPSTGSQAVVAPASAAMSEPSPDSTREVAAARPREDEGTARITVGANHASGGVAPGTGNQTARGEEARPQSANLPLALGGDASAVSEKKADSAVVPPAAPGTMATLGGCATGPEYRGMQPKRVVALYEDKLSRFERREVLDYDDVYFIGPEAKKVDAPVANGANFGYDDDRGDYQMTKHDHVAYRYEVLGDLGRGSFGQVVRVRDYKRNVECALKMIRNRKRFHQQAQIEIQILEHLRSRDPDDRSCTIRMLNYFQFRSHTCITCEIHAMNLYELTKLNRYQPFPPALIKRFTGQLLVSASFMWREQIVHCDLKPENILLKQENKTGIKVIDFGSSCFEDRRVYSYIQSRFYRAPEIIFGMPYGRPIDLWSIGCIVCEMAVGFPIFPGENEHEQLLCIMEVLGVPPARLVDKSSRKSKFFDSAGQPRLVPNSRNKLRRPGTKDLKSVLRTDDDLFVDFILKFLKWDPAERTTPNEAMKHPYIAECFHQDTIPSGPSTAGQAEQLERRERSARSVRPPAAAASSANTSTTTAASSSAAQSSSAAGGEQQPSSVASVGHGPVPPRHGSAAVARPPLGAVGTTAGDSGSRTARGSLGGSGLTSGGLGGPQSARQGSAGLPTIGGANPNSSALGLAGARRRNTGSHGRMPLPPSSEPYL